ncbi:MAG TPA: PIN domain-containing protein [Agriterribacter sp.]|nr:PIN domain-containing protein [Agriterribacter sp.]
MNIVFLDANVFLDAILKRTDDYEACQFLLSESGNSLLRLKTSSSCLLHVIYFLKKAGIDNSAVIQIMESLLSVVSLASANEKIFQTALHAGFSDLEDAIQYHTALQVNDIDYFITSNTKDFKKQSSRLPVITPKQFMTLYKKKG